MTSGWIFKKAQRTHPLNDSISRKIFVMLQAYMDDSGTHEQSEYCLVAGYWGGVNQWRKFERDWDQVLREFHVGEFHAKQFWGRDEHKERVGPYKGWDDDRRDSFLTALLRIIGQYKIYPFAHGVVRSEWNRRSVKARKMFCGGGGTKLTPPDNPMFMALQTCILRTATYCNPGVRMHFVIDSNRNTDAWASIFYADMKRTLVLAHDPLARKLGELTPADSVDVTPLQAADLLAYEAYQYAKWAKGDGKAKVRPVYAMALRNFRTKHDFWMYDAVRFANIEKFVDSYRVEDESGRKELL